MVISTQHCACACTHAHHLGKVGIAKRARLSSAPAQKGLAPTSFDADPRQSRGMVGGAKGVHRDAVDTTKVGLYSPGRGRRDGESNDRNLWMVLGGVT
jgi:hypothetical protein